MITGEAAAGSQQLTGPDKYRSRVLGELAVCVGPASLSTSTLAAGGCLLCLPATSLSWRTGERVVACPAGGAILLDAAAATDVLSGIMGFEFVIWLPRRFVTHWRRERAAVQIIEPSAGLDAVAQLARGLLAREVRLDRIQAALAGRAIASWLVATVTSGPATIASVTKRREATLLERLVEHVDRHLADDLDVSALCKALACSRSTLYRATGPVGGAAVFVTQRRLAAVSKLLSNPDERRTIAALARSCGFFDASAFSRAFKRHFGLTAADIRRRDKAAKARQTE